MRHVCDTHTCDINEDNEIEETDAEKYVEKYVT